MDLSFVNADFFDLLFILGFGLAWPSSVYKSYTSRTAKGKSLPFNCLCLFAYLCGIASHLISDYINYATWFYFLNFFMVSADTLLVVRNRKIDVNARKGLE